MKIIKFDIIYNIVNINYSVKHTKWIENLIKNIKPARRHDLITKEGNFGVLWRNINSRTNLVRHGKSKVIGKVRAHSTEYLMWRALSRSFINCRDIRFNLSRVLMCLPHKGDNLFRLFYNLNGTGLVKGISREAHCVYDECKV